MNMPIQTNADIKLENFDDFWGLGDPVEIEKKFRELLPQAKALADPSTYLQLLSQIALAQGIQKKFDAAHATLDDAERFLTPEYNLARVRILLERGRVFQQAENLTEAMRFFVQSFELSSKHKFDFHTINAAHMIAIAAEKTEEKIKWNQLAIDLAQKTKEQRAHLWLGSLYNNLGQNFLEAKRFEKALDAFEKALKHRIEQSDVPNIRVAKWAVARTLRALDRLDEALAIQLRLLEEYDAITASGNLDMPAEMFTLIRGWVAEEVAEIYDAKAKIFAKLAYADLSTNAMFQKTEPARLERLRQIQG